MCKDRLSLNMCILFCYCFHFRQNHGRQFLQKKLNLFNFRLKQNIISFLTGTIFQRSLRMCKFKIFLLYKCECHLLSGKRERESEIERQRDRETKRLRDRETERQRDRESERQRETEGQRDRETERQKRMIQDDRETKTKRDRNREKIDVWSGCV